MSKLSREDVERLFQQKLAELNHLEITLKQEFTPVIDACLKYFLDNYKGSTWDFHAIKLFDRVSKGIIRSVISAKIGSMASLAITNDTIRAIHAAMEAVLKWLDETNEQDPGKIGYIIDQYIRFYDYYFREDYHFEDPSGLKYFQPDLQFQNYKK